MNVSQPAPSLYDRIGGRAGLMALLRQFYADVRQHREIGPIFNARIQDWREHLEKIADFWAAITGGPARYAGQMPQRHFPLGLAANHFETWLDLWRRNCRIRLPASEANAMITLAEGIGARLQALIAEDHAQVEHPAESSKPGIAGAATNAERSGDNLQKEKSPGQPG